MFWSWLAKKRSWIDWAITIAQGAWLVGGATIPAWAVSASEWMQAWGPISWVAAGFLGLTTALGLMWLWAALRRFMLVSDIVARRTSDVSSINPLDDTFKSKRLWLAQVSNPVRGEIRDKTFIDCDIIGPGNMVVFPDCTFHGNGGELIDALVFTRSVVSAGFNVHNCTFRNCRFYNLTFMVPDVLYDDFQRRHNWSGLNWLTDHADDPRGIEPTAPGGGEGDVPSESPRTAASSTDRSI